MDNFRNFGLVLRQTAANTRQLGDNGICSPLGSVHIDTSTSPGTRVLVWVLVNTSLQEFQWWLFTIIRVLYEYELPWNTSNFDVQFPFRHENSKNGRRIVLTSMSASLLRQTWRNVHVMQHNRSTLANPHRDPYPYSYSYQCEPSLSGGTLLQTWCVNRALVEAHCCKHGVVLPFQTSHYHKANCHKLFLIQIKKWAYLHGERLGDRDVCNRLLIPVRSASRSCWNDDARLPCPLRGLDLTSPWEAHKHVVITIWWSHSFTFYYFTSKLTNNTEGYAP